VDQVNTSAFSIACGLLGIRDKGLATLDISFVVRFTYPPSGDPSTVCVSDLRDWYGCGGFKAESFLGWVAPGID